MGSEQNKVKKIRSKRTLPFHCHSSEQLFSRKRSYYKPCNPSMRVTGKKNIHNFHTTVDGDSVWISHDTRRDGFTVLYEEEYQGLSVWKMNFSITLPIYSRHDYTHVRSLLNIPSRFSYRYDDAD